MVMMEMTTIAPLEGLAPHIEMEEKMGGDRLA